MFLRVIVHIINVKCTTYNAGNDPKGRAKGHVLPPNLTKSIFYNLKKKTTIL